jgi:hypothetical protein
MLPLINILVINIITQTYILCVYGMVKHLICEEPIGALTEI